MSANLPPVLRNAHDGLPCETSRKCLLWLAEHHDRTLMKYRAEALAHECARLLGHLRSMMQAARPLGAPLPEDTLNDVIRFILKRWAVWRLGPNTKVWWEIGT